MCVCAGRKEFPSFVSNVKTWQDPLSVILPWNSIVHGLCCGQHHSCCVLNTKQALRGHLCRKSACLKFCSTLEKNNGLHKHVAICAISRSSRRGKRQETEGWGSPGPPRKSEDLATSTSTGAALQRSQSTQVELP